MSGRRPVVKEGFRRGKERFFPSVHRARRTRPPGCRWLTGEPYEVKVVSPSNKRDLVAADYTRPVRERWHYSAITDKGLEEISRFLSQLPDCPNVSEMVGLRQASDFTRLPKSFIVFGRFLLNIPLCFVVCVWRQFRVCANVING